MRRKVEKKKRWGYNSGGREEKEKKASPQGAQTGRGEPEIMLSLSSSTRVGHCSFSLTVHVTRDWSCGGPVLRSTTTTSFLFIDEILFSSDLLNPIWETKNPI